MNKNYDVIIIGAGNGGITTGALLAKNGLKTLVVERNTLPGGAASSIVRGRFEFETALHELMAVGPAENPGPIRQIFDSVGADIEWLCYMDETFRLLVPEDGVDAFLPTGVEAFCKKMEELVPGSFGPTMQFAQIGIEAFQAMGEQDVLTPEQMYEKYPNFIKASGYTVKEGFEELEMPEKAQHILATYWVYLGVPMSVADFANYAGMTAVYMLFGAGMPKYRSNEIALAMDQVIRDNGGEVWYNTEAEKILVKDGKAYGVQIGGKEYYAEYIVSNTFPDVAFSRMMDKSEVPERAFKVANIRKPAVSFMTIYLGMNRTAEELGIDVYTNFIGVTEDDDAQFLGCVGTNEYPYFNIFNCLNIAIPDCTPEGTCQLYFSIPYIGSEWGDLSEREYFKHKNKVALEAIKHVEKAMGIELLPYIEEIEIASPVTFARYLNTPAGTPYGYQITRTDGFSQRWAAFRDESFIGNLFFVGASNHKGHGFSTTYLSALFTLQAIMMAEMQKGGQVR